MPENSSHSPETVERFLDSTLDSVDSTEELAVGMAQRAGMDEDELMKIGMAIRESVVNAVVHGNRYNAHKKIRFAVVSNGQQFIVRIGDEGEGFESVADWRAAHERFWPDRNITDETVMLCERFRVVERLE